MRNTYTIRNMFLMLAVGVMLGLAAQAETGQATVAQAPARPNIVVIMADDLDKEMLDTLLALGFLPNIEQLVVRRGFRFNHAFVTNSPCCPSRATYLSGQYSHNHGVHKNSPPDGGVGDFDDGTKGGQTLATVLQRAGYRTAHVGKYLNMYGSDRSAPATSPENRTYVPPGWNRWEALVDYSTYNVYNYTISAYNDRTDPAPVGTPVPYGHSPEEYQTTVLAERAAAVIAEAQAYFPNQPLFLTVTPLAPHVELFTIQLTFLDGQEYADQWRWFIRPNPLDREAKPRRWNYIFNEMPLLPGLKPSFNEADVTDKPTFLQRPEMTQTDPSGKPSDIEAVTFQYRTRMAAMLAVDDLVGRVAAALGPDLARTVILFTSDNGFLHGEHRMAEKLVAYEESIRVPLYLAAPGVQGPVDVNAMVANTDLAPTLVALAGTALAHADGRSLLPLLGGTPPAAWRQRLLVEHWRDEEGGELDLPDFTAVRTGPADTYSERLYVEYSSGGAMIATELYDLTEPGGRFQLDSRHADPARAAEITYLKQRLEALKSCGRQAALSCQAAEQ